MVVARKGGKFNKTTGKAGKSIKLSQKLKKEPKNLAILRILNINIVIQTCRPMLLNLVGPVPFSFVYGAFESW